jgi:hypothetical protein
VDRYALVVESFTVHDTRALHDDTLWLNVSAFVDGDLVDSWSDKLGDFNNGTYFTPESVRAHPPTVINDPQSTVSFIFQLVNNGNVPSGQLSGRMAATADQLAGITSNIAGAVGLAAAVASGYIWAAIAIEGFANLWSWLDTDCDGPVAVDQVAGPRYWLDARTENVAHSIQLTRNYPGTDSPTGCRGNSNYDVEWSLNHSRTWLPAVDAIDAQNSLTSIAGVAAAAHNEMLHAFGVGPAGATLTHASTLKGVNWMVDEIGTFVLATNLAPSAVSFDDRLHVFGVAVDGQVYALVYTIDGASWWDESDSPPELHTKQAIATIGFLNRLYLFARDSATNRLRVTSSPDLRIWAQWTDVPVGGLAPMSAVSAAVLAGKLHLFGIYNTGKEPAAVVVHNSTADGQTWADWEMVEGGLRPQDEPNALPLDVAAGVHDGRVYVATRWETTGGDSGPGTVIELNFSGDGENWSGWRAPQAFDISFQPSASQALAAVHNHLYIACPRQGPESDTTQVWVY